MVDTCQNVFVQTHRTFSAKSEPCAERRTWMMRLCRHPRLRNVPSDEWC